MRWTRTLGVAAGFALMSCCTSPGKGRKHDDVKPVTGSFSPAQVFIVRHGEKPATGPDLNDRGRERARALPSWFAANSGTVSNGLPVAVYAAAPPHEGGSLRSIQTCQPFADQNRIAVVADFRKDQAEAAVQQLMSDPSIAGKSVLFCWEHNMIPSLATALGALHAPNSWPDEVFDRVWVLDYTDGKVTSLRDLPQHLLPGDADH